MNRRTGGRPAPDMLLPFAGVGMLAIAERYGVLALLLAVAVGFVVEWAILRWVR